LRGADGRRAVGLGAAAPAQPGAAGVVGGGPHRRPGGPDGAPVDDLGDAEEAEVAARLAELDPQADLEIDMRCSVCGEELRLPFDPAGFLLRELAVEAEALYREVHALALYYHWSERDILELPVSRRRFYLELLADTVPTAGAPA
jgi:hypothetical protein